MMPNEGLWKGNESGGTRPGYWILRLGWAVWTLGIGEDVDGGWGVGVWKGGGGYGGGLKGWG